MRVNSFMLISLMVVAVKCNLFDVENLRVKFLEYDSKMWKDHDDNDGVLLPFGNGSIKQEIVQTMLDYKANLSMLEKLYKEPLNYDLDAYTYLIDSNFEHFTNMAERLLEDYQLITFNKVMKSRSKLATSFMKGWKGISEIMTRWNLFDNHINLYKYNKCNDGSFAHIKLFNAYNHAALVYLKGYMGMQFLNLLLVTYGYDYAQSPVELKRTYYNTMSVFKRTISTAVENTNKLWRCKPSNYIEDSNYVALTKLIQGFITNELNLNTDGSCTGTCPEYSTTYNYPQYEQYKVSDLWLDKNKCSGDVYNCQYYSDSWKICSASEWSSRRYEYVGTDSRTAGRYSTCRTQIANNWNRWFVRCDYCFCLCDAEVKSDRYLSLQEYFSDIAKNMVVIGVRFRKVNRIIHLQIKQGELLPEGEISKESVSWVPLNEFRIESRNVRNNYNYSKLSWNERKIKLGNAVTNKAHIITGVGFEKAYGFLRLKVFCTPYDFKTGKLGTHAQSTWIPSDGSNSKISLFGYDVPIMQRQENQVVFDKLIEFTSTGFNQDVAQSTIPYFDAQNVESATPLPLKGIGLLYKGEYNYGGFIAPFITGYDFTNHLVT